MTKQFAIFGALLVIELCLTGCSTVSSDINRKFHSYTLAYETPVNPTLQTKLEKIDAELRSRYGMTTEQTAVGVLDLKTLRLALIHPDSG